LNDKENFDHGTSIAPDGGGRAAPSKETEAGAGHDVHPFTDAAGLQTRNSDDLVEVVGRQAPGTWLPLSIKRDGQEIDVIAKFPTRPRQDR